MKKTVVGIALAALIALGSYIGLETSVDDAIKIVFDKEAAKETCRVLLDADVTPEVHE